MMTDGGTAAKHVVVAPEPSTCLGGRSRNVLVWVERRSRTGRGVSFRCTGRLAARGHGEVVHESRRLGICVCALWVNNLHRRSLERLELASKDNQHYSSSSDT